MEDTNEKLAWLLAGAVIGVAIGILYAPTAGKNTREILSRKTQEGADAVADTGRDLVERGKEMFERGRELVEDASELFERGRKLMEGA